MSKDKNTLYCSFCGKTQHEIRKLVAGPTCFICNECIDLCKEIIEEGEEERRVKERLHNEGYVIIHRSKLAPEVITTVEGESLAKFNAFFKSKES